MSIFINKNATVLCRRGFEDFSETSKYYHVMTYDDCIKKVQAKKIKRTQCINIQLADTPAIVASLDQEFLVYNKLNGITCLKQLKDINVIEHALVSQPLTFHQNNSIKLTTDDCYALGYYLRGNELFTIPKENPLTKIYNYNISDSLKIALSACHNKNERRLPTFLLRLSNDLLESFIKGYYCGAIETDSKIQSVNLKDLFMIREIVQKIYNKSGKIIRTGKDSYMYTIGDTVSDTKYMHHTITNKSIIGTWDTIKIIMPDNNPFNYNGMIIR